MKRRNTTLAKLNRNEIEILKKLGYPDEDIRQIEMALCKTKYEINSNEGTKEISRNEAIILLGTEKFLSGIGRSAFHHTASRIVGDNCIVSFDTSKLIR